MSGPAAEPTPDREAYRVGEHYGIHVYQGDRPVATFHDAVEARRVVDALNGVVASPDALRQAVRKVAADLQRDHTMPPFKDRHGYDYRMGWWDAINYAAKHLRRAALSTEPTDA